MMVRHSRYATIKAALLINVAVLSFYFGWIAALPRSTETIDVAIPYKTPEATTHVEVRNNVRSPLQINISRTNITQRRPTPSTTPSRPKPWVILATTNNAFLDFTENWLESLKRSGIRDHVTIIAEDESTREVLARRNDIDLEIMLTSKTNLPASDLPFGSKEYLRLVNKRPRYILRYLEKGIDVLFTDVDTVWLQNPLPFFKGDYDVHLQRDIYDDNQKPDMVCAGFAYYSATNATIDLIRKWIHLINVEPEEPDQLLLNKVLQYKTIRETLKINFLDQTRFLNGNDYFNLKWKGKHAAIDPVVVHNNWIKGHDIKIERFKNASMWYL